MKTLELLLCVCLATAGKKLELVQGLAWHWVSQAFTQTNDELSTRVSFNFIHFLTFSVMFDK